MLKKLFAVGIMLFAASAFATYCPNLTINGGAGIPACKVSGSTCHYVTDWMPKADISTAKAGSYSWHSSSYGDNVDCNDDPCNTGKDHYIHWILNANNLNVSHYCPEEQCVPNNENEPTCTTQCGQSIPWTDNCGGSHTKVCPNNPTHNPPTCTQCGTTLPWEDSCGNDEEPVVCEECVGECVPETEPEVKCEETVTWKTCQPGDTALTGPTYVNTKTGGDCPCVPTEEGKPVCTEESCGKTLEWINNCGDKKYVVCEECACVPVRECEENECGWKQDNCGQMFACRNNCPPPPPPPGEWPKPDCNRCEFASFINIRAWNADENAEGGFEIAHFATPNVIRSFVVDFDDTAVYQIWVGKYNDVTTHKQLIPQITGPAFGEITIEMAGLPIQQWTEVWFTGGAGSMTMFLDTQYHIFIRGFVFKE